jgi:hypothetical protein
MANPQCAAQLPAQYTLLQDNSPGTHVWNNATGAFVPWSDATYQTWLNSTGPCQQSLLSAAVNDGTGQAKLTHDGSFTYTTGQVYRVFGTDSGVYDGIWTLTAADATHIILNGSVFSVGITAGGVWGPTAYALAATFYSVIDAYNRSLPPPSYAPFSASTVLATPLASWNDILVSAASAISLDLPQANLFGSPYIGDQIVFNNLSNYNVTLRLTHVGPPQNLVTLIPQQRITIALKDNSSKNGLWTYDGPANIIAAGGALADASIAVAQANNAGTIRWSTAIPSGDVTMTDQAAFTVCGSDNAGSAVWKTYTPTVTAQNGGAFVGSATGRYKQTGKKIELEVDITITSVTTAAGSVLATLPVNAAAHQYAGSAFEYNLTGKSGAAVILGSAVPDVTTVRTRDATGATFFVNGYSVAIGIAYEAA